MEAIKDQANKGPSRLGTSIDNISRPGAGATPEVDKQEALDLRKENYTLLTKSRRLELENKMLKADGIGNQKSARTDYDTQVNERDL